MKKLFLGVLACCALLVQAKEYTYRTVEGDPMQARIYTLENGLTVYLTENHAEPVIQTLIAVRAGSQNDPLESTGLAHYQEHIMFKGTKQYGTTDYEKEIPNLKAIDELYETYGKTTNAEERKAIYHLIDSFSYENSKIAIANEFDKLMASIGATGVNAYTSTDRTCYHEVIPSTELTRWAMIESDRFQNLVIRGFHTELETVYEEFNMYSTMDYDKVSLAIDQALFPAIPYRQHTVLGTQEHLKNPSLINIRKFYNTYYRPNNVAVCLSGDFDSDRAIEVIDAWFGNWKPQDIPAPKRYEQPDLKAHKDTLVYGKEAPEVHVVWKLPNIKHEDIDALEVMDYVLMNGKCGLIDLNLEQKQLTLHAGAYMDEGVDYSSYHMYGRPKEKQTLNEVRELLLAEVEKLKKGEFDENMLAAIIRNHKRSELLELQYNGARVQKFVTAHICQIPYEDIVKDMDRKEKITKDDVIRVANKYLKDNYVCVLKEHNEDANPPKIDKPEITPIEMNRDASSAFYKQLNTIYAEHGKPQFLDFEKDLSRTMLPGNIELYYCQNKENDLTELSFVAKKGSDQEPELDYASSLLGYLGTGTLTAEDYQTELYKQAAEAWVGSGRNETYLYLYGLKESIPAALVLMEDHVLTAKPDDGKLKELVKDKMKSHEDAKKDQWACYDMLSEYGYYGADVLKLRTMTPKQMNALKSADLLTRIHSVIPAIERVEYYGPLPIEDVKKLLASSKLLAQADAKKRIVPQRIQMQQVKQSEVLIAPYKANNVYIGAYANWGEVYNIKDRAIVYLFNQYFGGSMSGIVFQEMRESKALCYGSWAYYALADHKGECNYIDKGVMSQNDKLKECIETLNAICNDMPLSQAAFDNAKEAAIKKIEQRRFVRSQPIGSYIGFIELGWDHDIFKEVYEEIKNLTLEDVVAFQKAHVADKTYRYLILGDSKELDMNFLKTLGPVKKLSIKDIFVY